MIWWNIALDVPEGDEIPAGANSEEMGEDLCTASCGVLGEPGVEVGRGSDVMLSMTERLGKMEEI